MHKPGILLLANPNSVGFFKDLICRSWEEKLDKGTVDRKDRVLPETISSLEEFHAFLADEQKQWPEFVFVLPELSWKEETPLFEQGYLHVDELIAKCPNGHYFQVVFLSILEPADLRWYTSYRYHPLIQAFRHAGIKDLFPNKRFFEAYSQLHFEMIRAVTISDEGRADKINHDLASIKTKLAAGHPVFHELSLLLNDLRSFEHLLTRPICLEVPADNEGIALFLRDTQQVMNDIDQYISRRTDKRKRSRKPDYRVLIIEDEPDMLGFIKSVVSARFEHVDVMEFTASDQKNLIAAESAMTFIREQGHRYQVFILDLLYSSPDGQMLNFNGLDLYDLILKLYPFAAVRIITSLPRPTISRLSERVMINQIPISHLISKTDEFKRLEINLVQSLEEIIKQCEDNEKYVTAYQSIPKSGFFNKKGIRGQLYHMIIHNRSKFEDLIAKGHDIYELAQADPGYQIILSQAGSEMSFQEFITKLPAIMAYRRLIIAAGIKDGESFWIRKDAKTLGEQERRMGNRQLIYTQLGFNATFKEEGYQEEDAFKIFTKNFFAYERVFLADCEARYEADTKDLLLAAPVQAWFQGLLGDEGISKYLSHLAIEPDPVTDASSARFTQGFLNSFLRAVLNRFDVPEVQKLADHLVSNHFINDKPEVEKNMPLNALALFQQIEKVFYESDNEEY